MIINQLSFQGFRNLSDSFVEPSPNVNVVYGKNGQGKTNLLEGIWLLGGLKSFRGAKDRELIKHHCDFAVIESSFFHRKGNKAQDSIFFPARERLQ